MKQKGLILIMLAAFGLACAHHRDVRPSADGIHSVIIVTNDVGGGTRKALDEANHFCEERNQVAAIVSENNKYTSSNMNEKDYNNVKNITDAAQAMGVRGAYAGSRAIGKGYTVEMKFKCI